MGINAKLAKSVKSEYAVLLVLLLMCIVIATTTRQFAEMQNIFNIIRRTATTGIIALGMTFVIATGGIDLSVGGQVNLISCIGAMILAKKQDVVVVVLAMLIIGIFIGMLNGLMISYLHLTPFMVTLAMMNITTGLAFFWTTGKTLFDIPEKFGFLGIGTIGSIPIAAAIFIVLSIIAIFIFNKFAFGRRVLAVGGNSQGAWYAGINVKSTILMSYIISGLCSAIASVLLMSRLMSASPSMGSGMEMDAIAAVVVGGNSLAGGNGFIVGAVAGALIMEVITNWMNLVSVDPFLRNVIKGIIILVALIVDMLRRGKQTNS